MKRYCVGPFVDIKVNEWVPCCIEAKIDFKQLCTNMEKKIYTISVKLATTDEKFCLLIFLPF